MDERKIIEVKKDDLTYTISFKDDQPKETKVIDSNGIEYKNIARELLRHKARELNLSNDGFLYNSSNKELNTNSYFRRIWNDLQNKKEII